MKKTTIVLDVNTRNELRMRKSFYNLSCYNELLKKYIKADEEGKI